MSNGKWEKEKSQPWITQLAFKKFNEPEIR